MTLFEQLQRERELARVAHESDPMNADRFLDKAKRLAREEHFNRFEISTEMSVVWFCKTLQNWKALLVPMDYDDLCCVYYEVTYNGDLKVAYVDTYKKQWNTHVRDVDAPDQL